MAEQRSRLRSALSRLVAPQSEVHAELEQEHAVRMGGTPIAELPLRQRATVCGTLRSVTLRPRAGVPALEAELYDGSGSLSVVWLGRRHIAGVEPGRRLRVHGMVTETEGRRAVFNPRYELEPRSGHS
jgi:predicted thioesterase